MCDTDAFLLSLARSQADAVVTTGEILRVETAMCIQNITHDASLRRYRRDALQKKQLLISLVLTRSGSLPNTHMFFQRAPGPIVLYYTGSSKRPLIALNAIASAAAHGGAVLHVPGASSRDAIAFLQKQLKCASISIEAGPSTTNQLYTHPCAIDMLLLSVYSGKIHSRFRGARSVQFDLLTEHMTCAGQSQERDWRFQLFVAPSYIEDK